MTESTPPQRVYPSPPEPGRAPAAGYSPIAPTIAPAAAASRVPPPQTVWLSRYRSPDARAIWAIVAITVQVTFAVISSMTTLALVVLDAPLTVGQSIELPPFLQGVLLPIAVMGTLSGVLLPTVVPAALAAWAYRCRANLDTMLTVRLRWSSGWAACGWFIPIANLFVPYQVVREVWAVGRPAHNPSRLLGWWWATWIAQMVFFWLTSSPLASLSVFDDPLVIGLANVIHIGVALAPGVLGILVIFRVTALQNARRREWMPASAPDAALSLPRWAAGYTSAAPSSSLVIACVAVAAAAALAMLLVGAVSLIVAGEPLASVDKSVFFLWSAALVLYAFAGLVLAPAAAANWMHRAYRNLPALGVGGLGWSPGWAAGIWFVPIANLAVPYVITRELWPGSVSDRRSLLGLWWAACLAAAALLLLAFVVYIGSAVAGDVTLMLAELALALAALPFIRLVRLVTRHQNARAAAMQAAGSIHS